MGKEEAQRIWERFTKKRNAKAEFIRIFGKGK